MGQIDKRKNGFLIESEVTSNDDIAGIGSVLKVYMFIAWLNRFAKLVNVNSFFCCFLLMYHSATPTSGYLLIHVVSVYTFLEEGTFGEIKIENIKIN